MITYTKNREFHKSVIGYPHPYAELYLVSVGVLANQRYEASDHVSIRNENWSRERMLQQEMMMITGALPSEI
jgi:hypothetical protein